ncbi:MAG: leucine-rich repeat protein [Lachnospiraceae bacterium]|nr:leucine-rich repeat protein [Lachnospiraceae bacterium]
MRNVWKRRLALLLAFVMTALTPANALYTWAAEETVNTAATAEETTEETEDNDLSLDSDGTDLGDLLTAALDSEMENESGETSISDIFIEEDVATVSLEAEQDARLVVAVYDEDGVQMLASGSVLIEAGQTEISVALDGDIPVYFVIRGFLLDASSNAPLCTSYESSYYTEEIQNIINASAEDFDEELVLNLDENPDTNFAVYGDDTTIIRESDGEEIRITWQEDGTYLVENPGEREAEFVVGAIFSYECEDGTILIFKIASVVKNEDGSLTISEDDNITLTDVFALVKMEGESDSSGMEADTSEASEGVTFNGIEEYSAENSELMTADLEGSTTKAASYSVENGIASATVKAALTLSCRAYISESEAYCSLGLDYMAAMVAKLSAEYSNDISLGKLTAPIVTGLTATLSLTFRVEASGEITQTSSISGSMSYAWDSQSGWSYAKTTPEIVNGRIDAEFTAYLGLITRISLNVIYEKLFSAGMTAEAGVDAEVNNNDMVTSEDCLHRCGSGECFSGIFKAKYSLSGSVTFLSIEWSKTFFTLSKQLLECYYSATFGTFDWTACPYLAYRLTINVTDEAGEIVPDAEIALSGTESSGGDNVSLDLIADENGTCETFLAPGTYILYCDNGGQKGETEITIKDKGETCDLGLLQQEFDLTVSVLYDDDSPASGILIKDEEGEQLGVTDEEGVLTVTLQRGAHTITAVDEAGEYEARAEIEFPGSEDTVVIVLEKLYTVYAYVQDENGSPLGDIVISDAEGSQVGTTDSQGQCTLSLKKGTWTLTAGDGDNTDEQTIEVPVSSESALMTFTLKSTYTVTVIALDCSYYTDGETVSGAVIWDEDGNMLGTTNSSGELTFEMFSGTRNLTAQYTTSSTSLSGTASATVEGADTSVTVLLYYAYEVEVTVTDSNEELSEGAVVSVKGGGWLGVTDANGTATVLLPSGRYVLKASKENEEGYSYIHVQYNCSLEITMFMTGEAWEKRCGDAVYSRCDSEGNLVIYGTGETWTNGNNAILDGHEAQIRTAVVEEGVTGIGRYTFKNCVNLESVTFASGVTFIGETSFEYCTSLTSVVLPDGLTSVEYGLFMNCENLVSVTLPDTLTSIGGRAFEDCYSLTSIEIPDGVTSIGGSAFLNCYNLAEVQLPESLEVIGSRSFETCESLTSVEIPDGVTSIGSCAFEYCYNLAEVQIPDSVIEIGSYAFYSCSLTDLYLPDGLLVLGSHAFGGNEMTSVDIPGGISEIGTYVFSSCTELTTVTFPDGIDSIPSGMFGGCKNLTLVSIPESVTTIGAEAFTGCKSVVTIPAGVTSIGTRAFSGCRILSLTVPLNDTYEDWKTMLSDIGVGSIGELTITDGLTSIDDYEFSNGSYGIEKLNLPSGVTQIGEGAFYNCDDLISVHLSDGITSIGKYAFRGCSSLAEINLPDGITSIGDSAFSNCSSLTEISLPDSSTYDMGEYVFAGCSSLVSADLPVNLIIEAGTFSGCSNLRTVNISQGTSGDKLTIGEDAFYNCTSLSSVNTEAKIYNVGEYAFYGCESLTELKMSKVQEAFGGYTLKIDTDAFYGCSNLTLYVPSSYYERVVTQLEGSGIKSIVSYEKDDDGEEEEAFLASLDSEEGTMVITEEETESVSASESESAGLEIEAIEEVEFAEILSEIETEDETAPDTASWDEIEEETAASAIADEAGGTENADMKENSVAADEILAEEDTILAGDNDSDSVMETEQNTDSISSGDSLEVESASYVQYSASDSSDGGMIASYQVPEDGEYVILFLKSMSVSDLFEASNLLYIGQQASSGCSVTYRYQLREEAEDPFIVLYGPIGTSAMDAAVVDIASVSISNENLNLAEGESKILSASILPENTTMDTSVMWGTENPEIAVVDDGGVVTGVKTGTTVIVVETVNGKTDTCEVTVTEAEPSESGEKQTEQTEDSDEKQTENSETNQTESSGNSQASASDEDQAGLSNDGQTNSSDADQTEAPDADVDVDQTEASDAGDGVSQTDASDTHAATNQAVTTSESIGGTDVMSVPATKLTVSRSKVYIKVNTSTTIGSLVTPSNTTDSVTYTSSKPSVATVSASGKITGKKTGTAVITVKAGSLKKKVTVKVVKKAVKVTKLSFSKKKLTVTKGTTRFLAYKVKSTKATTAIKWKSSKKSVVSVDKNGKIVAKKKGTAVITISANGKKATCRITVK